MSDKKDKSTDNLIGFREFLEYEDSKNPSIYESNQFRGFDLITFLEQESTRLGKQINLFEEKVFMLKRFPQDSKIISEQETVNFDLQSKAISSIMDPNSIFFKNLENLLKDHFSY